ncbi:hypothetical protein [Frankia sp. CiP1_Cm_nod2]|uniref:hypothetical protein n=1 Tax=Frankia sp. CiP1_Cm_nod2 TaxID=2897161 RepID=UPI0020241057
MAVVVEPTRRAARPLTALVIMMLTVLVLLPAPAMAAAGDGPRGPAGGIVAAGSGGLQLDAVVNEVSVTGRRIVLDPERPTRVLVTVRNNRNELAQIRSIRVSGSALGLTFFVFDTAVRMDVPAGASLAWSVDVDMAELRGQATGLLPCPSLSVMQGVTSSPRPRGSPTSAARWSAHTACSGWAC